MVSVVLVSAHSFKCNTYVLCLKRKIKKFSYEIQFKHIISYDPSQYIFPFLLYYGKEKYIKKCYQMIDQQILITRIVPESLS